MPLRSAPLLRLLLLLSLLLPALASARAAETVAERAANAYAEQEVSSHPLHGNLLDLSLPPDKLAEAQHLAAIRVPLHFADEFWGIAELLLLLSLGVIGWMRDTAVRTTRHRWGQAYLFLLLYMIAGFLLDLPLDLYRRHLSLRYGLSVQSWASWFGDAAKNFLISWVIGGALLMLLFWAIHRFTRRWWLVVWAFSLPLTVFSIFVSPYIEPLFNQYEPLALHHPELVARLQQVVAKGHMDIPPERMFLMKASAKVTTMNADVEGFGHSKRVVVWDTTIAKMKPDEILLVFGHESGHYALGHIEQMIVGSFVGTFLVLLLGFFCVRVLIARFGRAWRIPSQADWGTVVVLMLVSSVLSVAAEPLLSTVVRSHEHAADVYGQEAVHGIVADPQAAGKGAFNALAAVSLADPNPNPLVEFWTYDHPALGRRAAFAAAYDPWAPGMTPRYFPKQ